MLPQTDACNLVPPEFRGKNNLKMLLSSLLAEAKTLAQGSISFREGRPCPSCRIWASKIKIFLGAKQGHLLMSFNDTAGRSNC